MMLGRKWMKEETEILEHCLRMSGIGSPGVLAQFREFLFDDTTLISITPKCNYDDTQISPEFKAFLTGRTLNELLGPLELERSCVPELMGQIDALRRFPVEVRDLEQEEVLCKVVGFHDVPTLEHLLEHLELPGGVDAWYIDVRDFYSTPGHMMFNDYDYHNFMLDWWLQGKWRWQGAQSQGSKIIIYPRRTEEQEDEARRGWFHVI